MNRGLDECGALKWGEPYEEGDARCTKPRGHTGPHVDHENHYGPVIWEENKGDSA